MKTKKPKVSETPAPAIPVAPGRTSFSIVGLGASAGGLEAYEAFFHHMPLDSGLAFVLISHLDPDHASMLTEILQRVTAMPVVEAQDQMTVEPNRVHVIPPNRDMAIFHGVLQLSVPAVPRGQRMPIDAFLRSLAEDQGNQAVGIVLSGTGTDGTQGLRAILGAGGITLAQEPSSAKYDAMPLSAIRAGFVTQALPVEDMPAVLQAGTSAIRPPPGVLMAKGLAPAPQIPPGSMARLLMLLRTATGHDFSLYKKSTIGRRIERRMAQHDIEDTDVYARYLKENPAEIQALFRELLINVTSFFRDAEAFAVLRQDILPKLLADKPEGYVLRVWVAGCASGEEAYSIAILLREVMDETHQEFKVQLYATDLDDEAIALARAGCYPPNIAADVTPERLRRYFIKEDSGYRVKKDIREMVVFAIQNVIKDPPFTRLDLLSCRNLMIYLEAELQNRLIPAFHYALKPGGILFLSPSESIGGHPELFSALSRKWKFYRAVHSAASTRAVMATGLSWAAEASNRAPEEIMKKARETNFAELTRRALLQSYAPASVVVDAKGNVLYVHGETGKFLRPAPGQASLCLVDMARDGLQLELRTALQAAASPGAGGVERDVALTGEDGIQMVHLSVRALPEAEAGQDLLLVSFQARPRPTEPKRRGASTKAQEPGRIEALENDLAYTRENLQATIEEQQASNEELKSTNEELQSTNEELQSTNEELQSTNEELETSKEELQSVNEELITVNAELQAKIEQLAGMQNDMKNLLDNINIGTVFLDPYLNIRRFTREATRVYRLVGTDVGRPLVDIKSDLEGDDLTEAAQSVMDTLVPCEREVRVTGGACYLARIQPYRTLDNVIEGVVLTFTDISGRKAAEMAELKARKLAESIVDTVREPLVVLDEAMRVVSASSAYYKYFQTSPGDIVGRSLFVLGKGQWDIPALREALETVLPRDQVFEGFGMVYEMHPGPARRLLLNGRRITVEAGNAPLILLAMEESGPA